MTWDEAQKLMESRGWNLTGVLRQGGVIHRQTYVKSVSPMINPIALYAQVGSHNEDCDACWWVQMNHNDLKYDMTVGTGKINLNRTDFAHIEETLALYGERLRAFNPFDYMRDPLLGKKVDVLTPSESESK